MATYKFGNADEKHLTLAIWVADDAFTTELYRAHRRASNELIALYGDFAAVVQIGNCPKQNRDPYTNV